MKLAALALFASAVGFAAYASSATGLGVFAAGWIAAAAYRKVRR